MSDPRVHDPHANGADRGVDTTVGPQVPQTAPPPPPTPQARLPQQGTAHLHRDPVGDRRDTLEDRLEARLRAVGQGGEVPRAAPLYVGPVQGSVTDFLQAHVGSIATIVFDAINGLVRDCEEAKVVGNGALSVMARAQYGKLALQAQKAILGNRVNLSVSLRSQEQVPDWGQIPEQKRLALEQALVKSGAIDVTALPDKDDDKTPF